MMRAGSRAEALVGGRHVALDDRDAVIEDALKRAAGSFAGTRAMGAAERAGILDRVGTNLAEGIDRLADELTAESGFLTRRDMVLEVKRATEVFRLAASAAREGFDEVVNLAASPRGQNTLAHVRREPFGPLLGITAFNGPILIAAHKIAPAIAAGAPVVLKPAPRVPRAAVLLADRIVAAGWPADALAVLPVDNDGTMRLIRDSRLPVISFTGGDFGWTIKDAAPRKHVHLELGGVGAVIVADDANLDDVAEQCVTGGFVRSGQACLSVQRIYATDATCDALVARLAERVRALRTGDPADPATDVGPLVDERAAERVQAMVDAAKSQGARVVVGGVRDGRLVEPTLLADVTPDMAVLRQEIFGPVIAVARVASLDEAVADANSVPGALLVGVFTRDIDLALGLADRIQAGGVIVNGSNAWRVDNMPFGGVGASGTGREGVRYMVEEITYRKVIVLRHNAV